MYKIKTINKKCLHCKLKFLARSADHKRGRAKYCSRSCSAIHTNLLKPKIKHSPNVKCAYCDKEFYLNHSKQKNSKSGLFFCCREHKDLAQRIGGIKEIQPDHYGTGYRALAWSQLPNKCNRCNYCEIIEILQVHHRDHNHSNNKLSNLEILCPNCHAIEHRCK
jgi:hypothetical protein